MNLLRHKVTFVTLLIAFTCCLILFQNCSNLGNDVNFNSLANNIGEVVSDGGGDGDNEEPPPNLPQDPICDPLGGGSNQGDLQSGLVASLYKWNHSSSNGRDNVMNYVNPNYGILLSQEIFFSQLNVTPRSWELGFSGNNGDPIRHNGEILNEYFSLEFTTELALQADQESGYYQLATLSDDGSIVWLDMNENGNYESAVNNNGEHSPKLSCAAKAIYLGQGQRVKAKINYFQGPRNHIALVMLWRKVSGEIPPSEQECGKVGTDYFFHDPAHGEPVVKTPWLQLLQRGWQVVEPANYRIPMDVGGYNPCIF